MDIEEQTGLLATAPEILEAVKVFPLIPHILKDVTVCASLLSELKMMLSFPTTRSL